MKQRSILYDTIQGQTISNILPDSYKKLYPKGKLKQHEVNLIVIDTPVPQYNSDTHKLISEYVVNLETLQYIRVWDEIALSDYELAIKDWEYPKYERRIVAPEILLMQFANTLTYFQVHNFPTKVTNTKVYLWCNIIRPEHHEMIDQANSYLQSIGSTKTVYEELKPEII